MQMKILKQKCARCGHERVLRKENPVRCPVCKHIPGTRIYKTKKNFEAVAPRLPSKDTTAAKPTATEAANE